MRDAARNVRPALLAGQWYPEDPAECREAIESSMDAPTPDRSYRGLIAPHAGFTYSGAACGRGYKHLVGGRDADLVVVFGSHRSSLGPNTVFRGDGWDTPLGELACAKALADTLARELDLEDEPVLPRNPDNGAELHLPFVRHVFPRAELLMLGVAAAPIALTIGEKVGALAQRDQRNVVFVGSTDLTHYGPNYGFEPQGQGDEALAWVREVNDQGFIDCVLALDPKAALEHAGRNHSACCPGAVAATLAALSAFGYESTPRLVDHYLSSDVLPASSFVGYASVVL